MKLFNGKTQTLETNREFNFNGDKLFFDTETTSLSHLVGDAFMISWTDIDGNAYALDLREHDDDTAYVLDCLRTLALDSSIEKIGHNVKFDVHFLEKLDFKFNNVTDTLVMSRLSNNRRMSYKLKDLAVELLGASIAEKKELDLYLPKKSAPAKITKETSNHMGMFDVSLGDVLTAPASRNNTGSAGFELVPFNVISKYAAADVFLTRDLYLYLKEVIAKDGLVTIHELERDVLSEILKIESRGFVIDVEFLQREKIRLEKELAQLETEIKAETGELDILSNDALSGILFDKLKLVPSSMTEKGKPKMDKFALDRYADKHPFVAKIKTYRDKNQYYATFIVGLLERQVGGTVYAEFNQLNARTGRMSSSNPNMQNIPNRDIEKAEIRNAFTTRDEYVLVSIDYSQIEYRLFAHYTQSAYLISLYKQDFDFHAETGKIFNKSRKDGKKLNFAIVYGMGLEALARELKCTQSEAKEARDAYFARIPEARKLQWRIKDRIAEVGFLKSPDGRRSYLTNDESYKGLNALIQMVAADVFKRAVVAVGKFIADKDAHIINMVHDDIVLEIHKSQLHIVSEIVKIMESVMTLRVPIKADVKFGKTWGDTSEWISDVTLFNKELADMEARHTTQKEQLKRELTELMAPKTATLSEHAEAVLTKAAKNDVPEEYDMPSKTEQTQKTESKPVETAKDRVIPTSFPEAAVNTHDTAAELKTTLPDGAVRKVLDEKRAKFKADSSRLKLFTVQAIKPEETYPWLLKKHYAKVVPCIMYAFGLYDENKDLVGVCCYGTPANNHNNNMGTFQQIELVRLVVNELGIKNMSSYFVSRTFDLLPRPLSLISYADEGKNHHGYIYQATNWLYTGLGGGVDFYINEQNEEIHSRIMSDYRLKFPEMSRAEIAVMLKWRKEEGTYKHRYFYFLGDKRQKKDWLKFLTEKYKIEPYPKGDNVRYDASFEPSVQKLLF